MKPDKPPPPDKPVTSWAKPGNRGKRAPATSNRGPDAFIAVTIRRAPS